MPGLKSTILFLTTILLGFSSCTGQERSTSPNQKKVGGPCEGCEAIYEYGNRTLTPLDTLPNFERSEHKLFIAGTVFQPDRQTPAEDVIIYVYHTNRNGIYETRGDEKGWARRHGYIRGWAKTGIDGKFAFYTFRPAAYPDGREPEHVHITLKEPDKNEYYIDSYFFDDDPLLTKEERGNLKNRGGSGIVRPSLKNGIMSVHRDIILGLNIPNYD